MNVNHKLQDELLGMLEKVAEDATIHHHDSQSGESFRECVVCGEWDGHEKECPMPAIELWIKIKEEKWSAKLGI